MAPLPQVEIFPKSAFWGDPRDKGEPGNARARLPARPKAKNRAIWLNPVPVARTSITGHARARPLPGL